MGFFKKSYYGTSNIEKSRSVISKMGESIRRSAKKAAETAPRVPKTARKQKSQQHIKIRW